MTDPTDTLIITFQTQLADVMETVLKTAMFEVSRLVEEGFLEEVRRRKQEVESLQSQLQKAERELSDEGGGEERNTSRMRCVDCCKPTVAPSSPMEGAKDKLSQSDIDVLKRCGLKQEEDFEDRWTESCGPEVMFESVLELDHSLSSPLKVFGEEQKTNLDLKVEDEEEEEAMLSCIADHHRTWTLTEHSSEGPEEPSYLGPADRRELHHQESPERWGVAAACDPPPPGHSLREDGLLKEEVGDGKETRTVRAGGEEFGFTSGGTEPATSGQTRAVRPDCVTDGESRTRTRTSPSRLGRGPTGAGGKADGAPPGPHPYPLLLPGPISSSAESPTGRLRVSPLGSAAIKEEIIIDSDEEEEKVAKQEEESARSESPRPRPLFRVRPEVAKQNHISQKSPLHGMLKHKLKSTNSLSGPSLPHPHRPVRKQPHPLPTNGAASSAGPQLVPPPSPFRTSSAPKPSPPSLALQRAFPGARRPSPLGLTHSHWASFKSHHQGSPSFAHPHALPGGRRLLCCGQCGKCFPHPSNLKAHQRTHTGERPFSCSLCGRTFTKISNLKAHRRVHTGERPYSCSACGKRFTQKCNLKRHQRIHLDNVL